MCDNFRADMMSIKSELITPVFYGSRFLTVISDSNSTEFNFFSLFKGEKGGSAVSLTFLFQLFSVFLFNFFISTFSVCSKGRRVEVQWAAMEWKVTHCTFRFLHMLPYILFPHILFSPICSLTFYSLNICSLTFFLSIYAPLHSILSLCSLTFSPICSLTFYSLHIFSLTFYSLPYAPYILFSPICSLIFHSAHMLPYVLFSPYAPLHFILSIYAP